MDDASWKRLLRKIHDGYVVPVIGLRLLAGGGGQQSLQRQVAERLLKMHGVQTDPLLMPFRELNDAVSLLKEKRDSNLQDLYTDIHELIQELTSDDAAIPAPLRQLAEISDFHLFVTLTPDDMFARSLRRRCAVNEIVHSPNLPSCEACDLPVDWHKHAGEVHLLYLFGKSSSAPMFAIHDEDILEYAHNIITRGNRVPNGFLNELQVRNLLLIGCNFPDWLSRFFLRVTSKNRLSEKSKCEYLIELQPEESLTCFLRNFCTDIKILAQDSPVDFVDELHRRWKAEQKILQEIPPEQIVKPGLMFFISYSRCTDLPRAEAMVQSLLKLGVGKDEVWFDRQNIEPGNDFRLRILDGIQCCRYFFPLLSLSAIQREQAFVFREWREADDRMKEMKRDFVTPVIVDTDYEPDRYKSGIWGWEKLDFGFAPDGVPNDSLTERLIALVRDARRSKEI
ncbi:MAG: toll/interleukin-1 receptor domain-containing protein [Deltaproteobacteria bacterium]|nr:toll/interleukin-1 receptor domain-containing protein [Deltaproteobacteria bacterium]